MRSRRPDFRAFPIDPRSPTPALRARPYAAQVQAAPESGSFTFRDGRSRAIDVTVTEVDGIPGIVGRSWSKLAGTPRFYRTDRPPTRPCGPFVEISAAARPIARFPAGRRGRALAEPDVPAGRDAGTRISLRGDGVAFTRRRRRFVCSRARPICEADPRARPHPDDAEIGAFGLYANRNATRRDGDGRQRRGANLRSRSLKIQPTVSVQGAHPADRQHHGAVAGRHSAGAGVQHGLLRRADRRDAREA